MTGGRIRESTGSRETMTGSAGKVMTWAPEPEFPPTGSRNPSFVRNQEVRCPDDSDIAEIKASLLLLKWMVGFTLAFVITLAWRPFA